MLKKFSLYLLRHSFVRFAMVGTAGYVVSAAVLALDTSILGLDPVPGGAFSIFIAMCFTWAGNRYLTFPDRRAHGFIATIEEWLRFLGANALGAVINFGTYAALVRFAHHHPLDNKFVAQACGVLIGLVFNFTLSRTLVFKAQAPDRTLTRGGPPPQI